MFVETAKAVADQVPSDSLQQGPLFPLQSNILKAEIQTAARVAELVFNPGLARADRPGDMVAWIRLHVYKPGYAEVIPAGKSASSGGDIFADRRFGHVFVYHNTAPCCYSARPFLGSLRANPAYRSRL